MNAEVDNQITFYVDNRIKNDFMSKAVQDVRCSSSKEIKTTDKQVFRSLICDLVLLRLDTFGLINTVGVVLGHTLGLKVKVYVLYLLNPIAKVTLASSAFLYSQGRPNLNQGQG